MWFGIVRISRVHPAVVSYYAPGPGRTVDAIVGVWDSKKKEKKKHPHKLSQFTWSRYPELTFSLSTFAIRQHSNVELCAVAWCRGEVFLFSCCIAPYRRVVCCGGAAVAA